jgi:hypothetical protein
LPDEITEAFLLRWFFMLVIDWGYDGGQLGLSFRFCQV